MATPGDRLTEPSGLELTYVETAGSSGGRRLVMDWEVPPGRRLVARAHRHPDGPEGWALREGSARYRVGGEEHAVDAPADWVIPTNTNHVHPWNVGGGTMRVRQTIEADIDGLVLGVERYFETLMALAQRGETDESFDISSTFQLAVTVRELLMPGSYIAGPPRVMQDALFATLAAVARRRGLTAYHEPRREPVA